MKRLRSYLASVIAIMAFCITPVFGQTAGNVPAAVTTSFATKYPNARVKKWSFENNAFTAKATGAQGKFQASFDQNGNWQSTSSTIHWSWNLPAEIQAAIRQSKYSAWRIDGIRKVESPSAGYYQLCVDDHFLHRDGAHAEAFTNNKVLDINTGGQLVAVKSISSPLLF